MIHVGVTATRMGMSAKQVCAAREVMRSMVLPGVGVRLHHGDCVGGDAQFEEMAGCLGWTTVAHPGPKSGWSAHTPSDERRESKPYMVRNQDIIDESPDLVIAAPYEMEPQPRGGTWATIAMARSALFHGTLKRLVVVGRDGSILDHEKWPLNGGKNCR